MSEAKTGLAAGKLSVLGTPIGNLGDLSPRAVETLSACDFIAAEDTRVTRKLLTHFGLRKPLISYHEHNKAEAGPKILDRLLAGEHCVLCTDAGMPAVSDPGQDLVALCHEHGVPVESVPGPTAFATALALSGMDSRRFLFEGFLAVDKKQRKEQLDFLKNLPCTVILYEAPHKLSATLRDLLAAFGDRKLVICRELTKIHEEVIRTTLADAAAAYPNNDLKGELVLLLEGTAKTEEELSLEEAVDLAKEYIAAGMSQNEAAKLAAKKTAFKKNDLYKALLENR